MVNKSSQSKISRRTVAKGAAWTVPAVALAASAPAASASPATCDVRITGVGVKYPTEKSVEFDFTVNNNSGASQDITIVSIEGPANTVWSNVSPGVVPVPAGESTAVVTADRTNNANGDAVITYRVCGQTYTTSAYVSI
ncbi:hypothetical protein [Flexivirga meconopsidis]|uniref:hypothetical protein n=1 Tax=Flexivirga meconopsidis TaxID=2977121 RepID=UPI00223FACEC|nr:hypothetical protein [Flexivirga meconopsidis]